jgi:hypothetical protein
MVNREQARFVATQLSIAKVQPACLLFIAVMKGCR